VLAIAVAAGVTWAATELTGIDRYPVAVAVLALVIGAALLPVWRRRQSAVDARYGRRQEDPARTLEDLADATRNQDPAPMRGPVFDLLRRFAPIVVVDGVEGMRFALPTDDPEVGRHTFVHGAYDLDAMRGAMSVLGGSLAGGTVLDVGANIGTSIVPLLTLFGAARGVAVEPEPRNIGLLRMNLELNDLTGRVDVLAMGLSDHDGTMELELSADNAGDHRIRVPGAALDPDEAARQTLQVPVRRLDALMEAGEVDLTALSLVWLDVQGHEGHVLAGAGALMAGTVPIVTEFWPSVMQRNGGLARFMDLVTQHVERIVDLRATQGEGRPVQMPAAKIGELAARYRDPPRFTDLLLLR
jgi:FkbM family methyltransferase